MGSCEGLSEKESPVGKSGQGSFRERLNLRDCVGLGLEVKKTATEGGAQARETEPGNSRSPWDRLKGRGLKREKNDRPSPCARCAGHLAGRLSH